MNKSYVGEERERILTEQKLCHKYNGSVTKVGQVFGLTLVQMNALTTAQLKELLSQDRPAK